MWDEATFICAFCGARNYIEVDPSAGFEQDYVEECQTCCQPNVLHVCFDTNTLEAAVQAEMESE